MPERSRMDQMSDTEAMLRGRKAQFDVRNRLNHHARWYDVKNKDGEVAEVRIYDEISLWGVTADDFVNDLDSITAKEIVVAMNCPGGNVFDGIAIYNALRAHPARVTTRVDALAASAASVIVQAGDHRVMLSASQMMIHEAWGLSMGNASDMREMATLLDAQSDNIAGIYTNRGGETRDHYRELMKAETWFSDTQAVEANLADEVVDPSSKVAALIKAPIKAQKTLNDEITEAADVVSSTVKSAERVVALRTEHGEELSLVNAAGLDELEDGLDQLRQQVHTLRTVEPDEELLRLKAEIEALVP